MDPSGQKSKTTVAVVGGGLVGALEACVLAQNGMDVHLFEYRKDIRTLEHVPGKSINLAMSIRGISALEKLGLGEHVAKEYGIPMRARMIHNMNGTTYPVPYGTKDQCIYSVGRRYVNEILLTAGEKFPNLHYHFDHKLKKINLETAEVNFERGDDHSNVKFQPDFVVGCDGAFSSVRKEYMRQPWFDYSQAYIPHAYKELCIMPKDGDYAMPPNYLHIWPRGLFMLIALPNQDKSFTVTLFMPTNNFKEIVTSQDLLIFFTSNFPDALELIGEERLIESYFAISPSPLISIKCSPYHWNDKCILLGDAAHAMVPFYGQGMNCGMEDVLVLDEMLTSYPDDRLKAFEEYTLQRQQDAHAICDLAMYNYIEMRDLVTKTSFLLRKKLDNLLYKLLPTVWVPLYTSVTFSRMQYHKCIKNKKWQDEVIATTGRILTYSGVLAGVFTAVKYRHYLPNNPYETIQKMIQSSWIK